MLTLAGDRFYEEEFNLGTFSFFDEFDHQTLMGIFAITKWPENIFKLELNLLVNIMMVSLEPMLNSLMMIIYGNIIRFFKFLEQ